MICIGKDIETKKGKKREIRDIQKDGFKRKHRYRQNVSFTTKTVKIILIDALF